MKVEQVYEILNTIQGEVLGENAISVTDETKIVDVGNKIEELDLVDKYTKKLVNHIGKVIFVNREYDPKTPSILMDSWEYGSILEKIDADMPDSVENKSWDLTNGQSYDQDVFTAPKNVRAKFFNKMTTFEVDISITDLQVKQSFSNLSQLNAFYSMIYTKIRNRMRMDYKKLSMSTITNFIGATMYRDYRNSYSSSTKKFTYGTNSYVRSVNLLALYKSKGFDPDNELTATNCLYDMDFLKFASKEIAQTSDRMIEMSKLFNIGNRERFSDRDRQKIILLSEFKRSADTYLQSETFHNEFTRLPDAETVTYWQGTGTDYSFTSTSKIHIKSQVTEEDESTHEEIISDTPVEMIIDGIIGVIFDRDALGVNNQYDRVPTHYNAKAEFTNQFYKSDARYFNDYDENFVVFFVA